MPTKTPKPKHRMPGSGLARRAADAKANRQRQLDGAIADTESGKRRRK